MNREYGSKAEDKCFKKKVTQSLLLLFGALILIFSGLVDCNGGKNSSEAQTFGIEKGSKKLQVGFITVGPVSDWGYNYQHNQGRLGMEARLREKVHTVIVENIPETADVERVMQRMCEAGAKLIYSTSYGYSESAQRVAAKNPGVIFMQALGTKQSSNLGTYSVRVWESAYVCGVVAAMSIKNDTHLGFIGAHPVPPIYWTVNAFALGAQSINPAITVDIVYTNSWNDPAAEAEALKSLATQGIKAVYVLVDSPIAAVQAAEQAGVYVLAHFADISSFAPKMWLTGSIWQWSKIYEDVTKRVLNNSWESIHYGGGFKEGYVGIGPFGPSVDSSTQAKAREIIAKITSDELNVFTGPIYDNKGNLKVKEGETLGIDNVLSFDWLVKGVK